MVVKRKKPVIVDPSVTTLDDISRGISTLNLSVQAMVRVNDDLRDGRKDFHQDVQSLRKDLTVLHKDFEALTLALKRQSLPVSLVNRAVAAYGELVFQGPKSKALNGMLWTVGVLVITFMVLAKLGFRSTDGLDTVREIKQITQEGAEQVGSAGRVLVEQVYGSPVTSPTK